MFKLRCNKLFSSNVSYFPWILIYSFFLHVLRYIDWLIMDSLIVWLAFLRSEFNVHCNHLAPYLQYTIRFTLYRICTIICTERLLTAFSNVIGWMRSTVNYPTTINTLLHGEYGAFPFGKKCTRYNMRPHVCYWTKQALFLQLVLRTDEQSSEVTMMLSLSSNLMKQDS